MKKIIIALLILFLLLFGLYNYKLYKTIPEYKNIKFNKISYVNKLYISDERYFNNFLNKNERTKYRVLFNAIKNYKKNIDDVYSEKIINALINDHPEFIEVENIYMEGNSLNINYYYEKEEIKKVQKLFLQRLEFIDTALSDLSDFEKIKRVYDIVGINNVYGDNSSAMAVLDKNIMPNNKSIAKASQIILRYIGIESILVNNRNIVRLDNKLYNFDASLYYSDKKNNISYSGLLYFDLFGDYSTPIIINKKTNKNCIELFLHEIKSGLTIVTSIINRCCF